MEIYFVAVLLLISVYTDIKYRKIINKVTIPAILCGFIYHILISGFAGFLFSGKGFLLGLGLLLIPFLLGGIGAGDVKLLSAVGALQGPLFVFNTFLFMALIGGLMAVFILIKRKEFIWKLKQMVFLLIYRQRLEQAATGEDVKPASLPYGVAIALGTVCAFFYNGGVV